MTVKKWTREQRVLKFGFDCDEELIWASWEPGGEYTKKLIMKNVSKKQQYINFVPPKSTAFTLPFPENIRLSPGMSHAFPIIFRPLQAQVYDDSLTFIGQFGEFSIQLLCTRPTHAVIMPSKLDLGFCPCKEVAKYDLELRNVGELPADFTLESEAPFEIVPSTGSVKPGHTRMITCEFTPQVASVFSAKVVCRYNNGNTATMAVTGIGKMPFISSSDDTVDFGQVNTSTVATTELLIRNQSLVNGTFTVTPMESDTNLDPVFRFEPMHGVVPPDSYVVLKVTYSPLSYGTFSSDVFHVSTPGGNTLSVRCVGSALPPSVSISSTSVNFGSLAVGSSRTKLLTITNDSSVPVNFEFMTEPTGTFRFNKGSQLGTIGPNNQKPVEVTFAPTVPINFYKRIFLLVKDRDPLYVDFMGTAYDDKHRPAPFVQRHVDVFHASRLGLTAPAAEQQPNGRPVSRGRPGTASTTFLLEESWGGEMTHQAARSAASVWKEFFEEHTDTSRFASVSEVNVQFGACSSYRMSEYKVVNVRNNSTVKCSVQWQCPDGVDNSADPTFRVFPDTADVSAGSTADFKVSFRPLVENNYYSQELECFVYPKVQRNFRLVVDSEFVPPCCVVPRFTGYTFAAGTEQFLAKATVFPLRLNFPPCPVGDTVYQILQISNAGDTPLLFQFQHDQSGVFACKPSQGKVVQNGFQLVAFRFSPTAARHYTRQLQCSINNNPANAVTVKCLGSGYKPTIQFENDGNLFIKPTCVGGTSSRQTTLTNPARIPVMFQWEIPAKFQDYLRVEPVGGVLRAHDSQLVTWSFNPNRAKKYSMKVPVTIRMPSSEGNVKALEAREMITIIGEGSEGCVRWEPEMVDFGTVQVGTSVEQTLVLINQSPCDLYFALDYTSEEIQDGDDADVIDSKLYGPLLRFDKQTDRLPAQSKSKITVTFTPAKRIFFSISLIARLASSPSALVAKSPEGALDAATFPICQIAAMAMFPTIAFVDARCPGIEGTRLWRELNLAKINASLGSAVSERQLQFNLASDMDREPVQDVLDHFLFELRPAQLHSAPTVVYSLLRNTGTLPVQFTFVYPDDILYEVELWVDREVLSEAQEVRQMLIDNQVFEINPLVGVLQPGESQLVTFAYYHTFVGEFRFPVVLKIENGRQLVMLMVGRTLDVGEDYLHLGSSMVEYAFTPTPLGLLEAPKQTYEIINGGTTYLSYELDVHGLEQLNAKNYDFEVMTCHNPKGGIDPGCSVHLEFTFQPLEQRKYEVSAPLFIHNAPYQTIEFSAQGFHPDEKSFQEVEDELGLVPLPVTQVLPLPGQEVFFSVERLRYGHIPTGSTNHQLVVLENRSHYHYNLFQWDLDNHFVKENILTITPSEGVLPPGGHVVCKMDIISPTAAVLDFSIECAIRRSTMEEGNTVVAPQKISRNTQQPAPAPLRRRLSVTEATTETRAAKISHPQAQTGPRATTAEVRESQKQQTQPQKGGPVPSRKKMAAISLEREKQLRVPLESYSLFLHLSAQAHAVSHHRQFFQTLSHFYIPKSHRPLEADPVRPESRQSDAELQIPKTTPRMKRDACKNMAADVLEQMLSEIVQDTHVKQLFNNLETFDTPFYVQLVDRPPTPFLNTDTPRDTTTSTTTTNNNPASKTNTTAQPTSTAAAAAAAVPALPALDLGGVVRAGEASRSPKQSSSASSSLKQQQQQPPQQRTPTVGTPGGKLMPHNNNNNSGGGGGGGSRSSAAKPPHMPAHAQPPPPPPRELSPEELSRLRAQALSLPAFEDLAHFVLEGCVYNLVREAVAGEFTLTQAPLQLVHTAHMVESRSGSVQSSASARSAKQKQAQAQQQTAAPLVRKKSDAELSSARRRGSGASAVAPDLA